MVLIFQRQFYRDMGEKRLNDVHNHHAEPLGKKQKPNGYQSSHVPKQRKISTQPVPQGKSLSDPERRLSLLAQLSGEIFDDPALVKECTTLAGQNVTSAILGLGKAFLSDPLPKPYPPVSKHTSPSLPRISSVPHYIDDIASSLPSLPAITDHSLSQLPFVHQGSLDNKSQSVTASYERLELLGDAYIELIATRLLYPRYPNLSAGRLSQIRETLVKNETLAEYSLAYKFDERAHMPHSHKEEGKDRRKVWIKALGDIFEAYVAAVVLSDPERGFDTAEDWLVALWTPKLPDHSKEIPINTDAKQELSRKIMHKGMRIEYRAEEYRNKSSEPKVWYAVSVHFTGWGWEAQLLGSGKGLNRSEAGMRAAMEALRNPLTAQIAAIKREYMAKEAHVAHSETGKGSSECEPEG